MPTPILGAPTWTEGQSLPATKGNEIVAWLEFFAAGGNIIDRDDTAPPGSPANGDAYVVATGGSGAWATYDDKIALRVNGAWVFITPKAGMLLYIMDEGLATRYSGTFGVDGVWNDVATSIPSGTQ